MIVFLNKQTNYESTNIKGLYFAGSLMQQRDYRKKQSAFIHGFRYNVKFLAQYLLAKHNQQSITHQLVPTDCELLTETIIKAVNHTSALWQQTGYLCDALVYDEQSCTFNYFQSIPVDYAKQTYANQHALLITLEFGQEFFDTCINPFAVARIHQNDYENAHLSPGLHPIVRHYLHNECLSTHHLIEDFENLWQEAVHVKPLKKYLKDTFMVALKSKQTVVGF